jgi:hypothetical protein
LNLQYPIPAQTSALGRLGQSVACVEAVQGCVRRKIVCITNPRRMPLAQSPSTVHVAPNGARSASTWT